jgi:hypothetical protein
MIFTESPLSGAYVVDIERLADERGFFARSYCADEFAAQGLGPELRQCSVSFNSRKGTLRGMHYQQAPHEEHKLVRCTTGAIFDVIVDIRPSSATCRRWFGVELTADSRRSLFIPPGIRPRVPDADGSRRGLLHDFGGACACGFQPGSPLERSGDRHRVAGCAQRHIGTRCRLSVVRCAGGPRVTHPRRVLVTGASGFIGRWSVAPLLRAGFDVHSVLSGAPTAIFPRN